MIKEVAHGDQATFSSLAAKMLHSNFAVCIPLGRPVGPSVCLFVFVSDLMINMPNFRHARLLQRERESDSTNLSVSVYHIYICT